MRFCRLHWLDRSVSSCFHRTTRSKVHAGLGFGGGIMHAELIF